MWNKSDEYGTSHFIWQVELLLLATQIFIQIKKRTWASRIKLPSAFYGLILYLGYIWSVFFFLRKRSICCHVDLKYHRLCQQLGPLFRAKSFAPGCVALHVGPKLDRDITFGFHILTFIYCILINPINVICQRGWMCTAVCVSHANRFTGGGWVSEN